MCKMSCQELVHTILHQAVLDVFVHN
jgi:hypothetical protein